MSLTNFLPRHNCISNLNFGGCPRNVYGGTRPEILHTVLLGLCEYIAEGIELNFTTSVMNMILYVI